MKNKTEIHSAFKSKDEEKMARSVLCNVLRKKGVNCQTEMKNKNLTLTETKTVITKGKEKDKILL